MKTVVLNCAPPIACLALPLCTTTETAVKETEDETMRSTFRGICPPSPSRTLPGVCAAVRHTAVKSSVRPNTHTHDTFSWNMHADIQRTNTHTRTHFNPPITHDLFPLPCLHTQTHTRCHPPLPPSTDSQSVLLPQCHLLNSLTHTSQPEPDKHKECLSVRFKMPPRASRRCPRQPDTRRGRAARSERCWHNKSSQLEDKPDQ